MGNPAMVGVSRIEIVESVATLKALMLDQPSVESKERLQCLYWLKSGQASNVSAVATLLGRHRTTVQRWLAKYRSGGMMRLLEAPSGQGRKSQVPEAVKQALLTQLSTEEGFSSYGEVQDWLAARGVDLTYGGTHYYVHNYLQASLKVSRPRSRSQNPAQVHLFKKPSEPNCD
ncbi:helix-turn-helix domain-containing protein [filamentous cyanobacterium LEGE 11480]|uniref:Helix-turn-helix domain-containing protein n=1 Tax=Romeriopsis navalis LEGE 11480 TaxID=2777977 RepID=A0A928VRI3_9CYAN|nr:helix-turn-helix domain-containing protein [Romeriopsis navalis]MBE9031222.1 helix-turn-helix domain-containing protein [Romeriopsis navalis LEGE 11480]